MMTVYLVSAQLLLLLLLPGDVEGHGRLLDPPGRSSMWRKGFHTPVNYNDHQLFCGGAYVQHQLNGGKCGVCGDPYKRAKYPPGPNEAGGRYAKGVIADTYIEGQTIKTTVEITAYHKGWFEFRICANNDVTKIVSQKCLNSNLLPLASDGTTTRIVITGNQRRFYHIELQLPEGMTCEQCVIQWKYHAGNNWGCFGEGNCCVGCGAQEEFYACSDVTILPSGDSPRKKGKSKPTTTTTATTTPSSGEPSSTDAPSGGDSSESDCVPKPIWRHQPTMYQWCKLNCVPYPSDNCRIVCQCPD